ncbi:hypothetical protein Q7P37_004052 [Cladosporium fusiforme]
MSTKLKSLHIPGKPIIFANVWDTISARAIAPLDSCKALATASYAIAIANNTVDEDLTFEQNVNGIREVANVVKEYNKPLTADIQDGYGERLEEAFDALLDLGVSGCNLEDYDNAKKCMIPKTEAAERVKRAMAVAKRRGDHDFVINARCDTLVQGGELSEVIERGKAYLEAGATTIFVWGASKRGVRTEEVKELVDAFDGRLSVKLDFDGLSVVELAEIGVARVSVGPSMQMRMMNALAQDAERLLRY